MSSPGARQRRRRQQYQSPRTRREIATAVFAALAIVGSTALLIWMLRPGGIADRQPRSSWLFGSAFFAFVLACYVVLRPKSRLRVDRRVAILGAFGAIAVVTVVAAVLWPGGLLRHTPKLADFTPPPTVPTAGSSTTGRPGATTAPAATTTPSTGAPATTTQTTQTTQTTIP